MALRTVPAHGDEGPPKKDAAGRNSGRGRTHLKSERPANENASDSSPLPGHLRNGTGRVSDPRGLRGDSKIEAAGATSAADERAVDPITPITPIAPIAPPPATPSDPTQPPAWLNQIPREAVRPPLLVSVPDAGPAVQADATDAAAEQAATSTTTVDGGQGAAPVKLKMESAPKAEPIPLASADNSVIVVDPLDQIRAEIKARLPYFRACAIAAHRRAGIDVRRVQATWFINADGTIRELRLDGVPEAQLATCITRVASRTFPVAPGVELTIPTPIVFVR